MVPNWGPSGLGKTDRLAEFDELCALGEVRHKLRPRRFNSPKQRARGGIAGSYPNDLDCGLLRFHHRSKVAVFCDEHGAIPTCIGADRRIIGIAQGNVLNVVRFMPSFAQPIGKSRRQLGINQEFHSAAVTTGWLISRAA